MAQIRLKEHKRKFSALSSTTRRGFNEVPVPFCFDRLILVQGINKIRILSSGYDVVYSEHHSEVISRYYFFHIIRLAVGERSLPPTTLVCRKHVISAGQHPAFMH